MRINEDYLDDIENMQTELLSDQEVVPGSQFWRLHAGIEVLCGEGLRATSPKTHNKFVHSTINTHQVSMYWHEQLRTIMDL